MTPSRAIYCKPDMHAACSAKANPWIGKFFGLVWMALVAACVGCTMCQAPYDYCASTIGPDGKPTGGFMTRQGSVLGGMPGVPVYQPEPTLAAPPTGQASANQNEVEPVGASDAATQADRGGRHPLSGERFFSAVGPPRDRPMLSVGSERARWVGFDERKGEAQARAGNPRIVVLPKHEN